MDESEVSISLPVTNNGGFTVVPLADLVNQGTSVTVTTQNTPTTIPNQPNPTNNPNQPNPTIDTNQGIPVTISQNNQMPTNTMVYPTIIKGGGKENRCISYEQSYGISPYWLFLSAAISAYFGGVIAVFMYKNNSQYMVPIEKSQ